MRSVAVVTDSNSGISQAQAESMGIYLLPMSFVVNNEIFYEGIDLTQEEFFRKLKDSSTTVSTTQPSPTELRTLWDQVLKDNESLVYIPMSSGLSASCATAKALAEEYNGRVEVIDNHRISVTQYQSVCDALTLSEAGYTAEKIRERLEAEAFESSIYIMVDTLKYLKQGGRITPAAAMIGSVLHLKPVLQIQGDKLDSYAKCRGEKSARRAMLDAIHKDTEERFSAYDAAGELIYHYSWSHTEKTGNVYSWKEEICDEFHLASIEGTPLSLSICCHIGPGALAITCSHVVHP